jgi:hypothetical protein
MTKGRFEAAIEIALVGETNRARDFSDGQRALFQET